ncbi:fatty acid desaturase family protein [Pseudomonas viciae]|uniref:Fatty acid desaturase family protein n=1 Tax=Pseudomonas viciae TaxID=2505979 RepID=A0ABY8PLW8_9PSED|nr:fatty acid desaturase family protein [Pseudomonas viciae]WGO96164.1 fatty acid desaturase family protein [Pseudomonas viciae]
MFNPTEPAQSRRQHEHTVERARLLEWGRPAPLRLLASTLWEWALILSAAGLAIQAQTIFASVLAVVFIATRQHALLILMHEFSHRQFSRTRPELNDTLGDFLTALPFTITLFGFRRDHAAHHRHTATDHDPNWVSCKGQDRFRFPKSAIGMLVLMLKHCVGLFSLHEFRTALVTSKMASQCPPATQYRQWIFALLLAAVLTGFHLWLAALVYWLIPMFTVLMALLYWRDVAEHFAMPQPGHGASRTVIASWWERLLIAPHGVGFHAEHHLYPAIPGFRLPQVHAALMKDDVYARKAQVTHGYCTGLIREIAAAGTTHSSMKD